MGIWGAGNFEEDTAAEHLVMFSQPLIRQIAELATNASSFTPDDLDFVAGLANAEILACLGEHLGDGKVDLQLPDPATIDSWRDVILSRWDDTIDEMHPTPSYKERRRETIKSTFNRLRAVAERNAPQPRPSQSSGTSTPSKKRATRGRR